MDKFEYDISSLSPSKKRGFELCIGLIARIALRMERRGFTPKEIADIIGCDGEEELFDIVAMAARHFDILRLEEDFVRIER